MLSVKWLPVTVYGRRLNVLISIKTATQRSESDSNRLSRGKFHRGRVDSWVLNNSRFNT